MRASLNSHAWVRRAFCENIFPVNFLSSASASKLFQLSENMFLMEAEQTTGEEKAAIFTQTSEQSFIFTKTSCTNIKNFFSLSSPEMLAFLLDRFSEMLCKQFSPDHVHFSAASSQTLETLVLIHENSIFHDYIAEAYFSSTRNVKKKFAMKIWKISES